MGKGNITHYSCSRCHFVYLYVDRRIRFLFFYLQSNLDCLGEHNTLELVCEPLNGILLPNLVRKSDPRLTALPACNAGSGPGEADEEVHAVNTGGGIVLDSEIDVLADSESEVAGLAEVLLEELVLLDLEATLEDLECLLSADGDVDGDLLVTTDSEGSEGVASLGVTGLLSGELFEHTGGTGEPISGLSDAAVKDELVNLDILHRVLLAFGRHGY